jgi:trypsin
MSRKLLKLRVQGTGATPNPGSSIMIKTLFMLAIFIAMSALAMSISTKSAVAVSFPSREVDWSAQPSVVQIVNSGFGRSRPGYAFNAGQEVTISCTGTYIASGFVLTAAHCIEDEYDENFFIATGPSNAYRLCGVLDTKLHPRYVKGAISVNDMALLRVARGCEPRTFPKLARSNTPLHQLRLYGWGLNQNSQVPEGLGMLGVQIETALAQQLYGDYFAPAVQLAAGKWFEREKLYAGACFGDSGGPLFAGRSLVGVVSWGENYKKTCFPTGPTIFGRVSNYRPWVNSTMRQLARAEKHLTLSYNSDSKDYGRPIGGATYAIGLEITSDRTDMYFYSDGGSPPTTPNFEIFVTGRDYNEQRPAFYGDSTAVYNAAGRKLCDALGDKSLDNTRWISYPTACLRLAGSTLQYLVLHTTAPRQVISSYLDLPHDAMTFPAIGLIK